MVQISINVDGRVRAQPVASKVVNCMMISMDGDALFLHGNAGQIRAFAEGILSALPGPQIVTPTTEVEAAELFDKGADLLARMNNCKHTVLRAKEFDFGVDPDSGYHDCGIRYVCAFCGAVLNEDDMTRDRAAWVPA